MAQTWRNEKPLLPPGYNGRAGGYEIERQANGFIFSARGPDSVKTTLPVKAVMGGERHGLSFLLSIDKLSGLPLERPALIEARYAYSWPKRSLAPSPGLSSETPATYEDFFGRVLSPGFEAKCLTCHGQPGTPGAGAHGGVECESCHGPGLEHSEAARQGKHINLQRGPETCVKCHVGFSDRSDPLPKELLVSSQVVALENSECFVQSGKALTCTQCHDPHRDRSSAELEKVSTAVCLNCHSDSSKPRAAICPVNARDACSGCHLPRVDQGVFHMTDHWIRVHSEDARAPTKQDAALRSQRLPLREFLRILVVDDKWKAGAAAAQIANGAAFSDVAHDTSIDDTAPGGGYSGEMWLSGMQPKLAAAAAKLGYGETSGIIDVGGRWIMLQRMPRDFRVEADKFFEEAASLKSRGDVKAAIAKDVEALRIYPYFLRALIFMGSTLAEQGDAQKGSQVLAFAAQLYPKDATAQFDLGLTFGALGNHEGQIQAFRRALEIDPDNVAAYESLGAALYAAGLWQSAIDTCRAGLRIDPLSANLYFNLSLMLGERGDPEGSKRARELAVRIDPRILSRQNHAGLN